jgi:glycosyltransferase involved in cell wall biosynthesis
VWGCAIFCVLRTATRLFNPDGGGYLAFLGRISPEKRPDRAIEIAKRAGIPLKLAAKVDAVDIAYFKTEIEPVLC